MKSQDYLNWALTKDRNSDQYQELVDRLQLDPNKLKQLHAVLGLSGEVGEVTDAVKKSIMYGKPLDVQNVKEECGDILWYLSLLLASVGSSYEEVMKMNHDKLEKRYPGGFTEKLAVQRLDKVVPVEIVAQDHIEGLD